MPEMLFKKLYFNRPSLIFLVLTYKITNDKKNKKHNGNYLDSLFKIKNFSINLVSNHASIHLGIHHFNGRHGLKKTKAANKKN